jgi:hypothetical protein
MAIVNFSRRGWIQATTSASLAWAAAAGAPAGARAGEPAATEPVAIGSRRELFVDDFLIERLDGGARLRLHEPTPREKVLTQEAPWEGIYCGYYTILQDGELFRLYYRGLPVARHALDTEVTCVAESRDGIAWTKPKLGLFEVAGTRENNVVLARHRGCHNFAPFLDTNPACPAERRYKALGGTGEPGLIAFASPDGIHWEELAKEPVITKGAFDSQNNAFWSESEGTYVCYFRVFREDVRWIARTTSRDFIDWTEPVDLTLDGKPRQHLYTNQIVPYARAPHIYLGMPTRFMPGRRALDDDLLREIGVPREWDYANDCADVLLLSTRGGAELRRTFLEAFVRPGLDLRNWTSRASYAVRGILPTSPEELSIYVQHNGGYPTAHVRRYTLRVDGFVSVNAPFSGGALVTRPFTFAGRRLSMNAATSAAGGLRVEVQAAAGGAIEGYALADCPELVGDRVEWAVRWRSGADLGRLAGKPVRLRFAMSDADLYSFQFLH